MSFSYKAADIKVETSVKDFPRIQDLNGRLKPSTSNRFGTSQCKFLKEGLDQ